MWTEISILALEVVNLDMVSNSYSHDRPLQLRTPFYRLVDSVKRCENAAMVDPDWTIC